MFWEVGATAFGLTQGVLVMLNKRSNWIFYIIQMLFLIMFSIINHLYGDIANNGFYLILGIIGFILWKREGTDKITKTSNLERFVYILIMLVGTIVLCKLLNNTDDPLPLLDSFTTVSSLVATYYMMKKKIDTWVIWFINDIFYAVEYFILPAQAIYLFALNIIWTFMAIASYVNWNKIMKGSVLND